MFIFDSFLSLSVFNHLPRPVDNPVFLFSPLQLLEHFPRLSSHLILSPHILSKIKTVSDICNHFFNLQIPLFSNRKIPPFIYPKFVPQPKSSP